jgi:hypothetical protein
VNGQFFINSDYRDGIPKTAGDKCNACRKRKKAISGKGHKKAHDGGTRRRALFALAGAGVSAPLEGRV